MTLRAEYCIRKDFGFKILIYKKYGGELGPFWEDVDWKFIGPMTLRSIGVNDTSRKNLGMLARSTARSMLIELGDPSGRIEYNGSLMPRNPFGILRSLRR